jgi:hypothetical protein
VEHSHSRKPGEGGEEEGWKKQDVGFLATCRMQHGGRESQNTLQKSLKVWFFQETQARWGGIFPSTTTHFQI